MNIILKLALLICTVLVILLLIFLLVLIDALVIYLRTKTDLLNRQIEEYDFSYPKNYNDEK